MSSVLQKFAIPVLAAFSFADATYLSVLHWRGEIPPCGGYAGCETVNTSPFAEIFGVPIAAFGMVLSAVILAIAIYRTRVAGRQWLYSTMALYALVLSAALFMTYLTGVEITVLHAICYWCIAMYAMILAMLVLAMRDIWVLTAQPATS